MQDQVHLMTIGKPKHKSLLFLEYLKFQHGKLLWRWKEQRGWAKGKAAASSFPDGVWRRLQSALIIGYPDETSGLVLLAKNQIVNPLRQTLAGLFYMGSMKVWGCRPIDYVYPGAVMIRDEAGRGCPSVCHDLIRAWSAQGKMRSS